MDATAADDLSHGFAALKHGRFAVAGDRARRALARAPAVPEGLFLLGTADARLGRPHDAVRHLGAALRLKPNFIEAHLGLACLLEDHGRLGPAIRHYQAAARLRPTSAAIAVALGNALRRGGRPHDAMLAFRQALRLQPGNLELRNSLGLLLRTGGDPVGARACFRCLLVLAPGYEPATINLALVEREAGRAPVAVRWGRRAVALAPARPEIRNTLGVALKAAGRLHDAQQVWRAALTLDPAAADTLGNLGGAARDLEHFAEAGTLLRRALAVAPQRAELHGILAYALSGEGRLPEAERACRSALALVPAYADAMCTLGLAEQRRRAPGAERWFDRAIATAPAHALARFNRGLFDLERGALPAGWTHYACRFKAGRAGHERRFTIPEWRGQPLAGKRLFIWREQGVGDEFLFASCYADAIAQAAQVVIECERRLVPLFARSFPRAIVRAEQPVGGRPPVETIDCDLHIAAGSLPALLRPTLAAFPPRNSWLFPDPVRMREWRRMLDSLDGPLRVGIAWRSQLMTAERRWSYAPLDVWGPVLSVPDVTFVNLQYDDCHREIARAEARFGVPIYELDRVDLKDDFENTASLIASLDLVIAPANSVAELAGALGVPTWRFGWRDWTHLGTMARPWYPAMRVFHPPVGGSLPDALERVAGQLRRAAAAARAADADEEPKRHPRRKAAAADAVTAKPH